MATVVFAIVGIPLMFLCLSSIGDAMAKCFRIIYWRFCCVLCTAPPPPPASYIQQQLAHASVAKFRQKSSR